MKLKNREKVAAAEWGKRHSRTYEIIAVHLRTEENREVEEKKE